MMTTNNPPSQPTPIQNFLHFIPGEIVFRVDHDEQLDRAGILNHLVDQQEIADDADLLAAVDQGDAVRTLTFDLGEPGCLGLILRFFQGLIWRLTQRLFWKHTRFFSLVFVSLPGAKYGYPTGTPTVPPGNHTALLQQIKRIDELAASRVYHPSRRAQSMVYQSESSSGGVLGRLSRIIGAVTMPPIFDIHAATFNWMGSAAQAVPTGGPGARPVSNSALKQVPPLNVVQPASFPNPTPKLDIYVLDTVPTQLASRNGNETFVDWLKRQPAIGPTMADTPLERWLGLTAHNAGSQQQVNIVYDNTPVPPDLYNPNGQTKLIHWMDDQRIHALLLQHDYDMSAHGPFVADVICAVMEGSCHSIEGTVHLYQVLNQGGVGTIETVANALCAIVRETAAKNNPAIINCSFAFSLPRLIDSRNGHTLPGSTIYEKQFGEQFYDKEFHDTLQALLLSPEAAARARQILEPIFDLLRKRGVLVVAAAGNEWDSATTSSPSTSRPIARYPAAFKNVVGVAAMAEKGLNISKVAEYSNRADEPLSDGFATFGGGVVQPVPGGDLQADPATGMPGLYVGDFPAPHVTAGSSVGWVGYWAGTSFAAPVITGALAVLRASGKNPEQAITHLRAQSRGKTQEGEDIIGTQ